MLRQLARLTRPLPAAGPGALAIAIYADATDTAFGARERGVEGVACVDDAARAVVLLSTLFTLTGNQSLRPWLRGLLDFVMWMHAGEGTWHNFILDWEGTRNRVGPTSRPGVNFWQARATEAAITGGRALRDPVALALGREGLGWAAGTRPPSDVRSIQAAAALSLLEAEPSMEIRALLAAFCDEIASSSIDGVLMNSPDERGLPHLWGHTQEAVLGAAAGQLEDPRLLAMAEGSAGRVWEPVIESGFALASVQPYAVQAGIGAMDALGIATGAPHYRDRARQARAWFDGRNPSGVQVYDRLAGRVADGIDGGVRNHHSGAESNLAAGLALARDPFVLAQAAAWTSRSGRGELASTRGGTGIDRPGR